MRAVVQRVTGAEVTVNGDVIGRIGPGLVVLLGVGQGDGLLEAEFLASKIANLRIFADHDGKFNLSVLDSGGQVLVVSQFTLYGDVKKGRRPSFTDAAEPEVAAALIDHFVRHLGALGLQVETGQFQAHMLVELCNDGPVTVWMDTSELMRRG